MTSYTNGTTAAAGDPTADLETIELRVISGLLQQQMGNTQQDQLSVLRNDVAFELGTPQPVPGN